MPVLSPGKSHGQWNLVGYSPWGSQRVRHDLVTKQKQHMYIYIYMSEALHCTSETNIMLDVNHT